MLNNQNKTDLSKISHHVISNHLLIANSSEI